KLLWIPRILLWPFQLLIWGAEVGAKPGIEFEQRHHLYDHLYHTFTSEDDQIGLRPTFKWVRAFRPSVGLHLFDQRLMGPGTKFDVDLSGGVDVFYVGVHGRPTRIGRPVQVFFDTTFGRRNDWIYTGLGATADRDRHPQLGEARYLQNALDV